MGLVSVGARWSRTTFTTIRCSQVLSGLLPGTDPARRMLYDKGFLRGVCRVRVAQHAHGNVVCARGDGTVRSAAVSSRMTGTRHEVHFTVEFERTDGHFCLQRGSTGGHSSSGFGNLLILTPVRRKVAQQCKGGTRYGAGDEVRNGEAERAKLTAELSEDWARELKRTPVCANMAAQDAGLSLHVGKYSGCKDGQADKGLRDLGQAHLYTIVLPCASEALVAAGIDEI